MQKLQIYDARQLREPAVRSLKAGRRGGRQAIRNNAITIRNSAIKSVIKPQRAAFNPIMDAEDCAMPWRPA